MLPDAINATYECVGGLFILNNCRHVLRDKAVAGVSVLSTAFFFSWGVWNILYYPYLGQMLSLVGAIFLASANALWIGLMLWFGRKK